MRVFLIVLAVLVVGVVALGFYQDWFHLTVNRDRIEEDAASAKKVVQGLGKQLGGKATQTESPATGKITKVDAAGSRFLMTTADSKELTMYTDRSSKVRLNDQEVELDGLRAEDAVTVAYDRKDGKNLATSVDVNRR
jgi:Cu/Ag efflux protein CusF